MSDLTGDARIAACAGRPPVHPGAPGIPPAMGDESRPAEAGIAREPERSSEAAPSTRPSSPTSPSLASLIEQARAAQEQLGRQPLPITNHNSQLILKLLGG